MWISQRGIAAFYGRHRHPERKQNLLAGLSLKISRLRRAPLPAMRQGLLSSGLRFVEINSTRAHKSGFKLATGELPGRIGFLSPNIFHVRANFAEVNLAVRGGDKTAVRRRRAIRREIYEVQAVALPRESVGVMQRRRLRSALINRATVWLNTGDVIIRGFMHRCAGNFLNNPGRSPFLLLTN
ncbi:Uncharacterized protein DBV15_10844 [Temnothorax longispinosus]|uniref:Uncharacterized protein n=1 Tax=Temnothorax longispinosus TaxID=300112 RepID=A0A4S2KHP0_9HYME|nr:Uncharacterized protein DBV15_10844 [Temnothorax longispinosus]